MKKIMSAVLAATLAVGLSACAGGQKGPQRNADGEIVVQFWHAQSGAAGKVLQSVVDQFNEQNQGRYEVHAIYQGSYEDNFAKLAANIQTGFVPGLMQASDVQTAYMKDSGIAMPMEEALGADAAQVRKELLPAVANYYVMDGVLWSMPMFVSQPTVYGQHRYFG